MVSEIARMPPFTGLNGRIPFLQIVIILKTAEARIGSRCDVSSGSTENGRDQDLGKSFASNDQMEENTDHLIFWSTSPMRHCMQLHLLSVWLEIQEPLAPLPAPTQQRHQFPHYFFFFFSTPFVFAVPRTVFARFLRCFPIRNIISMHPQATSILPHLPLLPHLSLPASSPPPPSPGIGRTYAAACSPSQSLSPVHTARADTAARTSSSPHSNRR